MCAAGRGGRHTTAEALFVAVIAAGGIALVTEHLMTAVYLIVSALLLLVSLLVIEPARARASFEP